MVAGALVLGGAQGWDEPVSGYRFLSPAVQRMQDDELANPGMLTVEQGRALFHEPGYNGRSCASCHGENGARLDPQEIARYPRYDEARGAPLTLQQRIDMCRVEHLDEFPLRYDADELVRLETYVRYLARGEPVDVDVSGPMRAHYEAGRELYHARIGQLQMACHHCHDVYYGQRLRDQTLTQGQVNGFPIYRLTTGEVSSLHRKFRNCYATLRARPYPPGSEEYIDLEVYVTARGNGLPIETPAVRH
ncbi:MAG: sulfur oxidation c-type cytochrome SoxA [Gammaproteobacteria bacterium]|nr:sulfur oxidation c-type cytochrome SoxA [Gammaproteobacteria bacterium]